MVMSVLLATASTGTIGVRLEPPSSLNVWYACVSSLNVFFLIQSPTPSAAFLRISFLFSLWGHDVRDDLLTTELDGL